MVCTTIRIIFKYIQYSVKSMYFTFRNIVLSLQKYFAFVSYAQSRGIARVKKLNFVQFLQSSLNKSRACQKHRGENIYFFRQKLSFQNDTNPFHFMHPDPHDPDPGPYDASGSSCCKSGS